MSESAAAPNLFDELEAADARFRALVEHNADGVVVVDRDGIVRYMNPAAERMFGRSADELVGELFGFPAVAGETTEVDVLHPGRPPGVAEMRVVDSQWRGEPVRLASLRDLTSRKQLEEQRARALREQLARREAETTARRVELLNRVWESLASSFDREGLAARFADSVCGCFVDWCAVTLTPPGGQSIEVLSATAAADPCAALELPLVSGDRALGRVAFARSGGDARETFDDTDRSTAAELAQILALGLEKARLYERATEAGRLRDRFLATVSHELRNSLQSTVNWIAILHEKLDGDPRVGAGLEVIERSARAQTQLVEDLLDTSQMISGRITLVVKPLDLAMAAAAVVIDQRPQAEAQGLTLVWHAPESPLTVRADANRLHQVITNLLSNAVKYTPRGGDVHVRAARDGEHARLEVSDSGPGIEPELLPELFTPFQRGQASQGISGLGLGLAVVRHLVDLHGGRVFAENRAEGGARLVVLLPLREA